MGCHKEEVCMFKSRVGEAILYFEQSINDSDFDCSYFMMKKYKVMVNENTFMSSLVKNRVLSTSSVLLCPQDERISGIICSMYRSYNLLKVIFIILFQLNIFNLLMC